MWALIEDDTVVRTFNHPESITINNIYGYEIFLPLLCIITVTICGR